MLEDEAYMRCVICKMSYKAHIFETNLFAGIIKIFSQRHQNIIVF